MCNILLNRAIPFLVTLFLGLIVSLLFISINEIKNKTPVTNVNPEKPQEYIQCASHHGCWDVGSSENLKRMTQALEEPTTSRREQTGKCKNGYSYRLSILRKPRADYTPEARKANITGIVRLKMTLSGNRQVTRITPLNNVSFGLTEQAISAAKKIEFEPEIRCGISVSVAKVIEYNFQIY